MSQSVTVASARILAYLNGALFGACTGFDWTSETPRRAPAVVDQLTPPELIPLFTMVSGNVRFVKKTGDGGIEAAGAVAQLNHIPEERYMTLRLVDRRTGMTLFSADQCAVTGQTWSVPERGLVTGSFRFQCIIWSNELALSTG